MLDGLRRWLLGALRIPPEPHPPEGSPGSVLVFRAGRNYYWWRVVAWGWGHALALAGAAGTYVAINVAIERSLSKGQRYAELAQRIWVAMEAIGFVSLAAAIVFTFLALRLNYELRWYMVTDRSLRIRHGVWSVEELTMTYANIQEIRVSSGPLQNWLGLADVVVSAAGGGTTDKHGHTVGGHKATFEGVENANEIRDLIVERLRAYRDSGLGERPSVGAAGSAPDALEAAHELLDEARRLRATVAASGGRFALKDEPGR